MPLECTIICMDNSEYMRNGDFAPTRFEAQYDAVSMLITAKTNANPESTVGFLTMAGRNVEVVASPTDEQAKLLSALHGLSLSGTSNVTAALQVAMLALKHRKNKRGGQRVILFVGSPITAEEKAVKRVGKLMKKNNIALDIISIGENAMNQSKLEGLLEAVNKNDNSHYVEVSTGTVASDVIRQSAIVGGGNSGGGGGGGGDNFAEFGGIDPNLDPELAMTLRVSMEEARQQANTGGEGGDSSNNNTANDNNSSNNNNSSATTMDVQGEDEDALLQQALQMSMAAAMGDANTNDNSMDVVNDKELDEGDEDDEAAQLAAAVAMSTNNNDTTEGGDTQGNESQFSDPSFVNQLLSDLPGVDMNDPQIQAAMAALGAGNKDSDDKEKDDDTK